MFKVEEFWKKHKIEDIDDDEDDVDEIEKEIQIKDVEDTFKTPQ